MKTQKIPHLDQLLGQFLGPKKTITDHETTRLTAAGENYGSLMLSVKIYVKDETGEEEEMVEAVAKLPPPGEFIQRMFNTPVTFRIEINFYKVIVPELKNFIRERKVPLELDCFPKFYGGRLSLSNKEQADEDAILVLENLKTSGYTVVDRTEGFDLKTAEVILKALAEFHGVPLAMKLLEPETFDKKIKSLCKPYAVFELNDEVVDGVIKKMRKTVEALEECDQYADKVEEALRQSTQMNLSKNSPQFMREPFATIIHTDAWVNNFMVKFVGGEATACKIVDFQLYEFGSPARDVVFFVFSSVRNPVLQKHYDYLIDFYHRNLIGVLEKFNCDTAPLSIDAFREEIQLVCKEYAFFQSLMMLEPIFATKDTVKELDEYNEEDMTVQREVPPKHKEKATIIVKEFIQRNLI